MYKVKYIDREKNVYKCNGKCYEALSLVEMILGNFRALLKISFGNDVQKYFIDKIKYEVKMATESNECRLDIKIKNNDEILERGQLKIELLNSKENINETIEIESEKFYGVKEMAALVGMERRKFSTYLERGKIIQPDSQLFNGPIWVGSRIENKKLVVLERGRKNEEF